jgi:putative hydrolase of the HAD superfamily
VSLPEFDTILFDAGGTIVYPDGRRIARLAGYSQQDAPARLAWAWYPTMHAYDEMLLATGKHWQGDAGENIWLWFWNQVASFAGLPRLDEAAVGRIMESNRERSLWDQTTDEVRGLLAYLHGRYKLGVVSNSDGTVAAKLADIGLAQWFTAPSSEGALDSPVIVDSHVVGISKPDPTIFQFALEPLDSDPARTVYIGDSYALVVVGARRAGLHPILFDPQGWNAHRDVDRVAGLAELQNRF